MKLNKFEVNSYPFNYNGIEKEIIFAFGEYNDTSQLAVVLVDCEEHKALCEISINIIENGRKKLKSNLAYLDTNSENYCAKQLVELLKNNKIAKPTKKFAELEGVKYEVYAFDLNKMWDLRLGKIRVNSYKEINNG